MTKNILILFCIFFTFSLAQAQTGIRQKKHEPYIIADSSKIQDLGKGLKLYVVEEGTGEKPNYDSHILINYQGRLKDGQIFDESYARPTPSEFPLNTLIKGWQVGLRKVKAGSRIILIVPPKMGYGDSLNANIPANSTLIFDIDLINVY
jgi:FKBP-type peptidyl-prolyl cis-trans isomerase